MTAGREACPSYTSLWYQKPQILAKITNLRRRFQSGKPKFCEFFGFFSWTPNSAQLLLYKYVFPQKRYVVFWGRKNRKILTDSRIFRLMMWFSDYQYQSVSYRWHRHCHDIHHIPSSSSSSSASSSSWPYPSCLHCFCINAFGLSTWNKKKYPNVTPWLSPQKWPPNKSLPLTKQLKRWDWACGRVPSLLGWRWSRWVMEMCPSLVLDYSVPSTWEVFWHDFGASKRLSYFPTP